MLVCQGTLVNPGIRLIEVTSKRATSVSSIRRHPPEVDPGTRSGSASGTDLKGWNVFVTKLICSNVFVAKLILRRADCRQDETNHLDGPSLSA